LRKPIIKKLIIFFTETNAQMALQPRFEDILHLVIWNGYVDDCQPAAYVSKETMTDERIWYPFLIQKTYGPKKKTLLQLIAEHSTHLKDNEQHKIIPRKSGLHVYKDENKWLKRANELRELAITSNHLPVFDNALWSIDADGNSIFDVACKNNCPEIVSYFIKRGVNCNEMNDRGGTPYYYAYNSKLGRQAAYRLVVSKPYLQYNYPGPKKINMNQWIEDQPHHHFAFHNVAHMDAQFFIGMHNFEDISEPPKKRLKKSEYKKQFGGR
jgi:hypothetical protein